MKLPIQLAYQRSISPSDVVFFSIWPDGAKKPLRLHTRIVLGMKEGTSFAYDDKGKIKPKVNPNTLAEGNPHKIDYCSVPYGAEKIQCEFSVSFSSEVQTPYKCSDPIVRKTLNLLVDLYGQKIGWNELLTRYLVNIFSGKWLWGNTRHAYSTTIKATPWPWENGAVIFNDIRKNFSDRSAFERLEYWQALVEQASHAVTEPNGLFILELKASIELPTNSALKPSQVFKEATSGEKNRAYQTTEIEGIESPMIGCYKAGAAITTIDDWYPGAERPVRIGHYGVDRQNSTSYRHPDTHKDFFSLIKRADEFVELLSGSDDLSQETINDLHFVVANLIKGGLYQQKGN
ncbi:type I-F CRISPR-associated protein Csy3 [Vibrio viridaestus]|uniref:Type I-F CRISPR-associated protein Csy3 n=1 Tax=Vibrio viridaestus TaxID=2487322 RepID=A0A3N9TL70_9VIBR|nr:type I-F CRISPR-associated protein Csy3 [Vibrio viridaestus]RQW65148.1 type I-F CRISPR-associated protein Csy3 [Vibrio viridaestus]